MKKATIKKDRKQAVASAKKNIAASFNRFKSFNGQLYTGVAVGRGHKWNYDPGVWIDKKVTPEKWTISYEVKKRRKGRAPEGSGAPVGTRYHWFILAHQLVEKLDANTYSTAMNGYKYKLAHRRTTGKAWNINDEKQKKKLINVLKSFIEELENENDQLLHFNVEDQSERSEQVKISKLGKASTSRKKSLAQKKTTT